jgi:hypothetical protein
MRDHITVEPSARYDGPLDDVPKWYTHEKCGAVTGMPEEIIRSYLANPFLYADRTFCHGCREYVPTRELVWNETGERMADYNDGLRSAYVQKHGAPPPRADI